MSKIIIKEYLGNSIQFKMVEGHVYANATSMCKVFNKKVNDWTRMKLTEDMINEVSTETGIPATTLILVNKGGIVTEQGTWIHEELILELASWLNVKFRRWTQQQIATLLREGKVEVNSKIIDENNKNKRLEIMEKNANVRMSKQFTKLAELTNDLRYKEVLIALGANAMSDKDILPLPRLEQKSYSAGDIGKILGISSNMVGRIANDNNLKTERYGYFAQDKAKHSNKSVESFRYYEHAIEEIRKYI